MFNFRKSTSSSVDKGWAWIVLLGCFLEYFVIVGMFKSFGLFFVEYQRKFSTSASVLSMVLSVQAVMGSATSIVIMGIGTRYFHERTFVILAAVFGLASNLGNAFAPHPSALFFTQSTLYALAVIFAHLPCTLMLGKYFEKRRGMANAVANVGGSIGGLVLPPLVVYLFGEYGLQGTLIIVGGVCLHFLPIGLLMRPIEREEDTLQDTKEKENGDVTEEMKTPEKLLGSNERLHNDNEYEAQDNLTESKYSHYKHFTGKGRSTSFAREENSEDGMNRQVKPIELFGSSADISLTMSLERVYLKNSKLEIDMISIHDENQRSRCMIFLYTIFDFSLLKNRKFMLLISSSFLVAATSTIPITYIPPLATDRGLQPDMIGYLVTIAGASDLLGRFLLVFIADNKNIQRHHVMTIAMTANGVLCLLTAFYTEFASLAVFGIFNGIFGGVYYSLINVLLVDFIGLKSLNYGLAISTVTRGISIALNSTLVGVIRDSTGSYEGGFYLMGVCSILGGLLLLLKPCISKYRLTLHCKTDNCYDVNCFRIIPLLTLISTSNCRRQKMFNFRKSTSSSVDKGWAWIVLLGCFLEYFVIVGMFKSFGLFFVEYQRKFSTSASVLSMVLSVQAVMGSVTSIVVMGIGTRYFHERTLVILAAVFGLASNLGNAFAPHPSVLFFTQSTLNALGVILAHLPCTLMLGKYFEKRRGMANVVANVGGSIGGLVLPSLVVYLFDEYGLQGTLIIVGGVCLHFLPIGLLMRPIEREEVTLQDTKEKENGDVTEETKTFEKLLESNERLHKDNDNEYEAQENLIESKYSHYKRFNAKGRSNSFPREENSEDGMNRQVKPIELFGSSADISVTMSLERVYPRNSNLEVDMVSINGENQRSRCMKILYTIFDFSLLKNRKFMLLFSSSFLVAAASTIPITYIPPLAIDRGLQPDMIGYLLTVSGASDLLGKFLLLFIADNKNIQRHHVMTIAMTANGVLCLMTAFYTEFASLAVFGILNGILGGVYYSLINVLLVDFIGLKYLNYGLAVGTVTRGISIALNSTLVGVIRDSTGSYEGGFYLMGVCSILGGLLLLLKPCISK
ncbi:uncharacterized protein LOC125659089 [Ostrea edulis]|uniref:uncharacterized protein LOC125659089 n=1 Tax=Ostrea edulis TaxID=37623 RepID=UPI0024AFCDAE|nr:uncharacterized protein LOC125659089 [Ostrea edulis]